MSVYGKMHLLSYMVKIASDKNSGCSAFYKNMVKVAKCVTYNKVNELNFQRVWHLAKFSSHITNIWSLLPVPISFMEM